MQTGADQGVIDDAFVGARERDLAIAITNQEIGLLEPWLASDPVSELGERHRADAKTELQELTQAHGLELPSYRHVSEEGPDHRKRFFVECWLGDRRLGEGSGATKKRAEQRAAGMALTALQVN